MAYVKFLLNVTDLLMRGFDFEKLDSSVKSSV